MIAERHQSGRIDSSVVMYDVDWSLYTAILKRYDEHPSRISYDNGTLEIMTLSYEHERVSRFLADVFSRLALAYGYRYVPAGSTTLKRKLKRKGLEPDSCYYVRNAQTVAALTKIDLRQDPPPDLVFEIDVKHAVVNREEIYAAFGVPEMWRWRNNKLECFQLLEGEYKSARLSRVIEGFEVGLLTAFAVKAKRAVPSDVVLEFEQWLKENVKPAKKRKT